jgi:hypothetical protein
LRSVLVAPDAGFDAATSAAHRRARAGETLPEGFTPYVLAIVGGASLMVGWLKIGGLLGGRDVDPGQFGYAELVFALVTGAVLAMLGQAVFGVVAPTVGRALGGTISRREARIVWGASAFPQVFTVLVLLPLFGRGMQVVGKLDIFRAAGAVVVAAASLSLVIVAGSVILLSVWG